MDGRDGRRIVITGYGVVGPCGVGKEAFWNGLLGPGLTSGVTAPVHDWDASPWYENAKEARRADRYAQFAMAAATMALEDGGDPGGDPGRKGVFIASGVGGLNTLEEQIEVRLDKGDRRGGA